MIDCSRAENYLAEKQRMTKRTGDGVCHIKCVDCPLGTMNNGIDVLCTDFETLYPEQAIASVQKWSNEHPQKTYLSEFLKNYPNAPLDDSGTPKLCPFSLGLTSVESCREGHNCIKCWNQPIEGGEK